MVATDRVNFLFADARSLYDDAIEMLDQGKIRNAAEKAWGATERATDGLVLHQDGEGTAVGRAGQPGARAFEAERPGPRLRRVPGPVNTRAVFLHVNCFYDGNCEPEREMAGLIRATALYIDLAERLSVEG